MPIPGLVLFINYHLLFIFTHTHAHTHTTTAPTAATCG